MNHKTSNPARLLRPLLILIGVVQLVLGVATALFPTVFFHRMGLAPPPPDNQYMLAMLASRFLAFGVVLLLVARNPTRHRLLLQLMLGIQLLDLTAGLVYTGLGIVDLGVSAFPMTNAAVFAGLLFWWMPRREEVALAR